MTPHFTLAELTKSQTALRMGIDNTPDDLETENLWRLGNSILEPVRTEFGKPFTPSSGFRSKELEVVLCRKSIDSWLLRHPGKTVEDYLDRKSHVKGEAVDFEVPGVSNFVVASWVKNNLLYDQLILEYYTEGDPNSGWIHCSLKREDNRKQALIFNGSTYKPFV